jgi:hypothetical protein
MSQVVEHLPSKHETLSSLSPVPGKVKKKNNKTVGPACELSRNVRSAAGWNGLHTSVRTIWPMIQFKSPASFLIFLVITESGVLKSFPWLSSIFTLSSVNICQCSHKCRCWDIHVHSCYIFWMSLLLYPLCHGLLCYDNFCRTVYLCDTGWLSPVLLLLFIWGNSFSTPSLSAHHLKLE